MKSILSERIENRARLSGSDASIDWNGQGDDQLLFVMQDNHHEFTIGVTTILECLLVSEREGAVPELDEDWKRQVNARYRVTVPESCLLHHGHGQCCDNHLLFGMRDNFHEFFIGITTILETVRVAESESAIPELDSEWWIKVMQHYPLNLTLGVGRK